MWRSAKKKQRPLLLQIEDEDRISKLSDDLLHSILSFLDAKQALQTCLLSKRWKLVWTTLPFLSFDKYENSSPENTNGLIRHVLSKRNDKSDISTLKLCNSRSQPPDCLVDEFVKYAIEHNLQELTLESLNRVTPYKLPTLSSKSLKKLTLQVKFETDYDYWDIWDLPALTSLRLIAPCGVFELSPNSFSELPDSCLTCLPSLTSLSLDYWGLSSSSFSFSMPHLITLRLYQCKYFPQKHWNFPALSSLELDSCELPGNISHIFRSLVNLKDLTLFLTKSSMEQRHSISCPQLLNLNIGINCSDSLYGNFKVSTPKLRNFSSAGILSITLEVPEVENVRITLGTQLLGMDWVYRKKVCRLFTDMLSELGNAKNLTFDFFSIKALSDTDFLSSLPSPFYNLKIVRLPIAYNESRISNDLRSYLLGASPRATIVTTFPKAKISYQDVLDAMTIEKVMQDVLFATPADANSGVDANRVRQIGIPVAGTSSDRASSSRGDSDFGLWQNHEVKLEFVGLLDLMMKNYPQTFEHYTAKSERFHTMMLNMLCTSVNEFLRTSMSEFNTDLITEYRDLFADLQRWGFDIAWLVSHLNYVEQLLFSHHELHAIDSRMNDPKNKLQELQNHCVEKITKIQKASG